MTNSVVWWCFCQGGRARRGANCRPEREARMMTVIGFIRQVVNFSSSEYAAKIPCQRLLTRFFALRIFNK
jgi:hypothetical protein